MIKIRKMLDIRINDGKFIVYDKITNEIIAIFFKEDIAIDYINIKNNIDPFWKIGNRLRIETIYDYEERGD